MTLLFEDIWMSGGWRAPETFGDSFRDVNGTVITVGATVKFVGTVVSVGNTPHWGDIVIDSLHPNGEVVVFQDGQGLPRVPDAPAPDQAKQHKRYAFQAVQLVVGT